MNAASDRLYSLTLQSLQKKTDRLFAGLMLFQWLFAIVAALVISPRTWTATESAIHPHLWAALLLGGIITSLPVSLVYFVPGTATTRHVIAIAQMLMSALLIHLTGGRIETHFHVFGSLAILAFYRDINVLISASIVVGLDHLLRGVYWPESVFGVVLTSPWRWVEHVGWVVFEDVFLIMAINQSLVEMQVLALRQADLEKLNETLSSEVIERRKIEAQRLELLRREEAARHEAEKANRLKDQFLATLSHELRTPLTSILGWVRLLRSGKLDLEQTEKSFEIIERNSLNQSRLIEDLLDVSRILNGKFDLNRKPIQIASIVHSAADAVKPVADAKNILLNINSIDDRCAVLGDSCRLQQVIWNLLTNAVKFTPSGGSVSVTTHSTDTEVVLKVTDTGKGISREFLPRIFERFAQADQGTSRHHGGLGLGLAIVRHITELHGGIVAVESQGEGTGATFVIKLPRSERPVDPITSTGLFKINAEQENVLQGVHVLLVEDDEDTRLALRKLLEQYGALIWAASSVDEALGILRLHQPDIVLTDIAMPGKDGYALLKSLREEDAKHGRHTPAAAVTALARAEDRQRAITAGFEIQITKPVEPAAFAAAVARLTEKKHSL
jgi:signal transduction histidine kinase/CheY-like chemotaxis protein